LPFKVIASKKGAFPVAIEKRAKGKKVTVVSNVQGNCEVSSITALPRDKQPRIGHCVVVGLAAPPVLFCFVVL
jgi:hypothetical protein